MRTRPFAKWKLLLCLYVFRCINALICQTFFQPDEFFQSLEVAHKLVFGYGWTTWEWRPENALRSPVYPLIFVTPYWIISKLGLDDTAALIWAPKLVQAAVATAIDYYTIQLTRELHGHWHIVPTAVFVTVSSFYNAGVAVRSFSNSLETALTAAALCYWPWINGRYHTSLWLAGFACVVRPTNAVIWIYLCVTAALRDRWHRRFVVQDAIPPFLGCIVACLLHDTWFYGTVTFTPVNFVRNNVLHNISVFYGANPWHFYLTQALPFNTLALLPFVIAAACHNRGVLHYLTFDKARNVCLWTAGILSLISHKEFRFIQPLLPVLHALAADNLYNSAAQVTNKNKALFKWPKAILRRHAVFVLSINIPATLIFILVHMRGQVSVTRYLNSLPPKELSSLGFLMPCHSTPWQSHLHLPHLESLAQPSGYGRRLWAITCEPPERGSNTTYQSQDDLFYSDPFAYIRQNFPPKVNERHSAGLLLANHEHALIWPSHLVVFDELLHRIDTQSAESFEALLREKGYKEVKRIWNSIWHEDPRRKGDVVVFRHRSVSS